MLTTIARILNPEFIVLPRFTMIHSSQVLHSNIKFNFAFPKFPPNFVPPFQLILIIFFIINFTYQFPRHTQSILKSMEHKPAQMAQARTHKTIKAKRHCAVQSPLLHIHAILINSHTGPPTILEGKQLTPPRLTGDTTRNFCLSMQIHTCSTRPGGPTYHRFLFPSPIKRRPPYRGSLVCQPRAPS